MSEPHQIQLSRSPDGRVVVAFPVQGRDALTLTLSRALQDVGSLDKVIWQSVGLAVKPNPLAVGPGGQTVSEPEPVFVVAWEVTQEEGRDGSEEETAEDAATGEDPGGAEACRLVDGIVQSFERELVKRRVLNEDPDRPGEALHLPEPGIVTGGADDIRKPGVVEGEFVIGTDTGPGPGESVDFNVTVGAGEVARIDFGPGGQQKVTRFPLPDEDETPDEDAVRTDDLTDRPLELGDPTGLSGETFGPDEDSESTQPPNDPPSDPSGGEGSPAG